MARYATQGTAAALAAAMARANVQGAMAVNVVFHGYDHSYIEHAIRDHPGLFRGGLVTDPLGGTARAVAEVARLHARGFTSVRLKGNLWPGPGRLGIRDEVGSAVMQAAGSRGMSVAVLSEATEDDGQAEEIEALCRDFPATPVIVDHFGHNGGPAPFRGAGWQRLLALSKFDNAHVKVTGWHPHGISEAGDATLQLIARYGAGRLLYGTNFPITPVGRTRPASGLEQSVLADDPDAGGASSYERQWARFDGWCAETLSEGETELLAGGTAGRLYQFELPGLPPPPGRRKL
jgi:predicted TIM-barrel fold metal-dependent hydrolase